MRWLIAVLIFLSPLIAQANPTQFLFNEKTSEVIFEGARRGDPRCQCILGILFEYGIQTPQNYDEAIQWYSAAAVQGYPTAQKRLGMMIFSGKGIPENRVRGFALILIAASTSDDNFIRFERDLIEKTMTQVEIIEALAIAGEWLTRNEARDSRAIRIINLGNSKESRLETRLVVDDGWSITDSTTYPERGTFERRSLTREEYKKIEAQKNELEAKIKELETLSKEHKDRAFIEFAKAIRDSMIAGLSIVEVPPIGILEGYFAIEDWKEMGREYSIVKDIAEKIENERELLREIDKKREEENGKWR